MGETRRSIRDLVTGYFPFSILERIVMGETVYLLQVGNGHGDFQYPRTDRDG